MNVNIIRTDPRIAFAVRPQEDERIEVQVNFGLFAGRDVTSAEIDRLAEWLLVEAPNVTILAEERHEIGRRVEASVHIVRIEVSGDALPAEELERDLLEQRLVERADHWARACIAERHGQTTEL